MLVARFLTAGAAVALISANAIAATISLGVENQTSRAVRSLSAFPVSTTGKLIEDNIGGHYDAIPPGGTAQLALTGRCGDILLLIIFEGGLEQRAQLNTCATRKLTLNG